MPLTDSTDPSSIKVLWLSHVLPWPAKGGLQQRSYYLTRAVARRHQVRLITFTQRAHQPSDAILEAAVTEMGRFCSVSDVMPLPQDRGDLGQLRLAARSLLPGPPYTVRWGLCQRYAAAVRRAVGEFRPDIVHFDTVSLAPYLGQIGSTSAVLNHHNVESHMLRRRAGKEDNPLRKAYFLQESVRLAKYERRVASRFQLHLVCSKLDARRLRETVGNVDVRIVPNGVDLEYFQPAAANVSPEPFTLIFVGGLSWYPNVEAIRFFLAEVWPLLRQRVPGVRIRVIGKSPPEDLLSVAQAEPGVEFLGFVDDIRPFVHGSSVYVCPIRDGGGTKLKMLDAMAMGMPIVAHPVAAEGLGLADSEQCLLASEPVEFAQKIASVLESEQLRKELGVRARKHVESFFSFDCIGTELAETYRRICEKCAHP